MAMNDFVTDSRRQNRFLADNMGIASPIDTWGPCGIPQYSTPQYGSQCQSTSTTITNDSIRRERELMKWNKVRSAWDNSAKDSFDFPQATTPRYAGFPSFGFESSPIQHSPNTDSFYQMRSTAAEQPVPVTLQRRYTYQIPTDPFNSALYQQSPIARPKQHSVSSLTDFPESPTSQFSLVSSTSSTNSSATSSRRPSSSTTATSIASASFYSSPPGSANGSKCKKSPHKHCTWCGHTGHQKQNCRDLTAAFRDGIVHARKGKICLGRNGEGGEPIPYPHGEKTLRDWVWKRRGLPITDDYNPYI